MARFFGAVVDWQRQYGRHGLPWQGTREPYRVWLSEIMLQQTQVATVLTYYPRFLQRFPDVQSLSAAPVDEVLALWSGLGYYSRARNLHRCAQVVVEVHGGLFPENAQALQALPGIGASTAAAIAAFCFGERISILDGNVRRVISRLLAFEGDLAEAAQQRQLWNAAQALLPPAPAPAEMVAYTQGLMDLGASLCARSRPRCGVCPVESLCAAQAQGRPQAYPVRTRKLQRRAEDWWMLVWRRPDGALWLAQRPVRGIWSGLHAFAVFGSREDLLRAVTDQGGREGAVLEHPVLRHSLTHRELFLHLVEGLWPHAADPVMGPDEAGCWVGRVDGLTMGIPAPLRAWLERRFDPA